MTSKIPIVEIFYSIQGEGKYIGHPSVFIRVGGCNLTCPSFSSHGCDSFYAVDKKYKSSWKMMSIAEIIAEIEKYPKADIVLTGREPTLYYQKLYPIIEKFKNQYPTYTKYLDSKKEEFLAFLKYPETIRKLINSTNALNLFILRLKNKD